MLLVDPRRERLCSLASKPHHSEQEGLRLWCVAVVSRPNRKVEVHVEGQSHPYRGRPKNSPEDGQTKAVSPEAPVIGSTSANMEGSLQRIRAH